MSVVLESVTEEIMIARATEIFKGWHFNVHLKLNGMTRTRRGAGKIATVLNRELGRFLSRQRGHNPSNFRISFLFHGVIGSVTWGGDDHTVQRMNKSTGELPLKEGTARRNTWARQGVSKANIENRVLEFLEQGFDNYGPMANIEIEEMKVKFIIRNDVGNTAKKVNKVYRDPKGNSVVLCSSETMEGYCFYRSLLDSWKRENPKEAPLIPSGRTLKNWREQIHPDLHPDAGVSKELAVDTIRRMGIPALLYREADLEDPIQFNPMDERKPVHLMLHDNHWWVVKADVAPRKRSVNSSPLEYGADLPEAETRRKRAKTPKCEDCNRANKEGHVCNPEMKRKYQANRAKRVENSQVTCNVRFVAEPPNGVDKIGFFDFETGPFEGKRHHVYAAGWRMGDRRGTSWGKNSLQVFMETVGNSMMDNWMSFGGSIFDNVFVLRWWMENCLGRLGDWRDEEKDWKPNIVMRNGRIIHMTLPMPCTVEGTTFLREVNFLDCMCHINGSLAGVCSDFGIKDVSKGTFPHLYMTEWSRLEEEEAPVPEAKYWPREEVPEELVGKTWNLKEYSLTYLRKDVECLAALWTKYEREVWNAFKVDAADFMTISQMAWNLAMSTICPNRNKESEDFGGVNPITNKSEPTIKNHTFVPLLDDEKLNATLQSIYGGRVWIGQHAFVSDLTEKILNPETTQEQRKELYKELDNGKHLNYLDVNGLYGYCLQKDYPCGKVRNYSADELALLESEITRGMALPNGIYHVRAEPSRYYRCRLPRKKYRVNERGLSVPATGLMWDMTETFEGWYNHRDLNNAVKAGYGIQFYSGFTWEKEEPILKEFIAKTFEIKMKGQNDGNTALREVGKLAANATYGKSFERPSGGDLAMFTSNEEFTTWTIDNTILSMIEVSDDCIVAVGENQLVEKKLHRRPIQIGSCCLGHSRDVIYYYEDKVYEHLGKVACYGDTDSLIYEEDGNDVREILQDHLKPGVLGDLANDIKAKGKETPGGNFLGFAGIFVAPKTYMIKALDAHGQLKTVMKAKGIPKRLIQEQWYWDILEKGYDGPVDKVAKAKFDTLKRFTSVKDARVQEKFATIEAGEIERSFAKEFCRNQNYTDPYKPGTPFYKEIDFE